MEIFALKDGLTKMLGLWQAFGEGFFAHVRRGLAFDAVATKVECALDGLRASVPYELDPLAVFRKFLRSGPHLAINCVFESASQLDVAHRIELSSG
jgi:hypothetical protein